MPGVYRAHGNILWRHRAPVAVIAPQVLGVMAVGRWELDDLEKELAFVSLFISVLKSIMAATSDFQR